MLGGQCKVFRKAKSLISQEKWSYVKSEYWRETENTATSTVRFLKLQLLLAHILQLDDHRREKIQGWFSDRLQLQMVPTEITKRKTSSLRLQQEVKDANAYLYLNLRFPSRFIYCFKKRFSLKAMICAHYLITPPYSSVKWRLIILVSIGQMRKQKFRVVMQLLSGGAVARNDIWL